MESANPIASTSGCASNEKRWFKTDKFCVCKSLLESFQEGRFCDVVLIADDGRR